MISKDQGTYEAVVIWFGHQGKIAGCNKHSAELYPVVRKVDLDSSIGQSFTFLKAFRLHQ
jgi:hypothetical protein